MRPLLIAVQSYTAAQHEITTLCWKNLDLLFATISVIAVYRSVQNSRNTHIKYALWLSWFTLFVLILNEKLALVSLAEFITYIPALTLACLHIYNLIYCQCKTENCCNNSTK
jgi:hypothetical protein|tara:strand:- start:72 stop:407 length:336 start_codon:yes stop_codon:yes gene_type:complete